MPVRTTVAQRQEFFRRHQMGHTYAKIAIDMGASVGCVRYWCRIQRDGGDARNRYHRACPGLLSTFDRKVRCQILLLRRRHPRWGPHAILAELKEFPAMQGLRLPSVSQISRFLRERFGSSRKRTPKKPVSRPKQPKRVHQRWQIDFKLGIALKDRSLVNLHTVRDPLGEACLGGAVYLSGEVGKSPNKIKLAEVRTTLRRCFMRWGTLPEEVQTDHDTVLVSSHANKFPSDFTLWLKGLGIKHELIRSGRPTDNSEVERCHRTLNDYILVGNEHMNWRELQRELDERIDKLAYRVPSRAEGCAGVPPVAAHPDLLSRPRPFLPGWEEELFDLSRIDQYLSEQTWDRKVGKVGRVSIARKRYSVGRKHAGEDVVVRFDPSDRHFVFYTTDESPIEICRRPTKGLNAEDLIGQDIDPAAPDVVQLPLPMSMVQVEGV